MGWQVKGPGSLLKEVLEKGAQLVSIFYRYLRLNLIDNLYTAEFYLQFYWSNQFRLKDIWKNAEM